MGFDKVCRRLLEYGVLAPSIYNSQPWRFQVDGANGVIEVQAYFTNVRPFEVDPEQATMARLKLEALPEAAPEHLFASMLVRQTHAGSYKNNSVFPVHLDRLKATSSASDHEKLYLVNKPDASQKISALLHDLSHEASQDEFLWQEATRWTKPSGEATEGIPMKAIGLPISTRLRFGVLRHWSYQNELKEVGRQVLLRQGHGVEAPGYLLITSTKPGRESYFQAGRWWTRLSLTLSELELGSQPLFLPITLKHAHQPLREIFGAPANEQPVLLVRFGQPLEKKWPRTNRRQPALDGVYFVE